MPHTTVDTLIRRSLDTGIRRGAEGRWVAGVCLGLGARYGNDPVLIRVAFIVSTVFGGIGIPVYLLAWLLLPAADGIVPLDRVRRGDGVAITLLVLTATSMVAVLADRPSTGTLVGLVTLVAGIWWLTHRDTQTRSTGPNGLTLAPPAGAPGSPPAETAPTAAAPLLLSPAPRRSAMPDPTPSGSLPVGVAPPPPPPPTTAAQTWAPPQHRPSTAPHGAVPPPTPRVSWGFTLVTIGLAVVADALTSDLAATGLALEQADHLGGAAAVTVLGIALIVAGLRGRRAGVLTVCAWIVGLGLITATTLTGQGDAGDVTWRPVDPAQLQSSYQHGAGEVDLDLRGLPVPAHPRAIAVNNGAGDLTIHLPAGVTADIEASTGAGSVKMRQNGETSTLTDGVGVEHRSTYGHGPQGYTISAEVGAGDVLIVVDDAPAPTPAPSPTVSTRPSASTDTTDQTGARA